jgi:hypothetical protein
MKNDSVLVPVSIAATNPEGEGGPSRIPITSHIDHQTSNSLFVPSPFLTYLKPIVIAFYFFSFLGILGNKSFRPTFHIGMWALYTVAFRFRFSFRTANLCVVRTQWVGSY